MPLRSWAADNEDLETQIGALIGTHNFALPISFVPDPVVGIPAGVVTFATNLKLKDTRAVFVTPGDRSDWPNTADSCAYAFELPQSEDEFSNLLGFVDLKSISGDWGVLDDNGSVEVQHANTGVNVSVNNVYILPGQSSTQTVSLPPGVHPFEWRADTQISDAFDIIIPAALLTYNAIKYGGALANQGASAAQQLTLKEAAEETLKNIALATGLVATSQLFDTRNSVTHTRNQQVTIYKAVAPEIATTQSNVVLEATDYGGVRYERVAGQLAQTIDASDPCGMPFSLGNDAPLLLGVGSNDITWTVSDSGPLPGGGGNSNSLVQQVVVEDTQAPILVAPPGRVIEVPVADPGLDAASVMLGAPRVVDLADPAPQTDNDGPAFYPIDSRSPITWTATDQSGNFSQADQLITIKAAGSNTAPVVDNVVADTLTSQPVDIVLRGEDPDFLDGRFDPLSFRISERPANGEFVAPLYPFFIEDYRTSPGGPYGQPLLDADNPNQWLYQNVCQVLPGPDNDKIALDWVHRPQYVHVTDAGIYAMIDFYFRCGPSSVSRNKRLSFWDADGEFIEQVDYIGSNNTFVVDQDSFLYTLRRNGGGSSTSLLIAQSDDSVDPEESASGGDSWRITASSANNPELGLSDPIQAESLSYARVDTREGLLYVTDRRRVFVFDVLEDLSDGVPNDNNDMNDQYRGALNGGAQFLCNSGNWGNDWTGFAMDVDPDGNLYVADSCADRIHKFGPSTRNAQGEVMLGDYVGWMGRCETSTNNACDEQRQTSKGYSCTDATCSVGAGGFAGSENGQFSELEFIALDPKGVLYATDDGDPDTGGRVQRFGTDGSFGGVARSTGTGINQGDQPGFVLGNLGTVRAVSVNSTQFFVVDQKESFVHVFETSPLKDITESSVTVTYVSNFGFHSDIDSFEFIATDGLADSNVGTVFVSVSRNFRPPLAFSQSVVTAEDQAVDITLEAEDPDGIIGVDFNGLDELGYQVVEPPAHGQVELIASDNATATVRYTPEPDYFGSDRFTFVANDGVDDSEPAEVAIEVTYVDDPPRLTKLEAPPRVGLGFPVAINAEFEDDGASGYSATFLAGDGSPIQNEGGIVEENDEAYLDGILLIEPVLGQGAGRAVAQHTYTGAGPKTMTFCVADQLAREDCAQQTVTPEPLVSLGVSLPDDHGDDAPPPFAAGEDFFIDVAVGNLVPEGAPGLSAQSVFMEGTISGAQVTFTGASEGDCQIGADGLSMDCDFGDFVVGEERTVRLFFASDGTVIDDGTAIIDLSFTTASPAVNEVMNVSAVRLIDSVIGIFRDRFVID
ncbi:Ig-like domain-containing protein [Wenzhouxiangella sp. EGI_FJ10409]|uniref:Ig-like domain-containing protein n=1 Tax=Wenzhouxiangella sp. EGI_FJ10409 TaxID=3243767 RepID=UPI0035E138A0